MILNQKVSSEDAFLKVHSNGFHLWKEMASTLYFFLLVLPGSQAFFHQIVAKQTSKHCDDN